MVSEKTRRLCVRWAVGLLLVSSPLALADPPDSDPLASQEGREQAAPPPLINLKFAGGTAAQFVEAIRTTDARPNVVINDATLLGYVSVPPVELISVTVQGALSILERCRALDSQGREIELFTTFEQGKEPRGGGWVPSGAAIYQVTAKAHGRLSQVEQALRVFSIERVRAMGGKDDDVLAAVEAALSLSGAAEEAQVKFHAETGLLMVRGTPEQVGAVDEVLDQLMRQSGGESEQLRKALADATKALEDCKEREIALMDTLEVLKLKKDLGG